MQTTPIVLAKDGALCLEVSVTDDVNAKRRGAILGFPTKHDGFTGKP